MYNVNKVPGIQQTLMERYQISIAAHCGAKGKWAEMWGKQIQPVPCYRVRNHRASQAGHHVCDNSSVDQLISVPWASPLAPHLCIGPFQLSNYLLLY